MRYLASRSCVFVAAFVITAVPAFVAAQQATSTAPTFEVATVKRNLSADQPRGVRPPQGGSFAAVGLTLSELIRLAFSPTVTPLFATQVADGPTWINTDRFDIIAKASDQAGSPPNMVLMLAMLRSLLIERFTLTTHNEQRSLPTYEMVLARQDRRLGPRLRRADGGCVPPTGRPPLDPTTLCGFQRAGQGTISARGLALSAFAAELSYWPEVQRPVRDKTALAGTYDLDLDYAPMLPSSPDAPVTPRVDDRAGFFTALQEQLGLKLEPKQGPVDVLVIDRAEAPAAD